MDERVDYPRMVKNRDEILSLPVAVSSEGFKLYHNYDWCVQDNIVVVYDNQVRGWLRGMDHARYRAGKFGSYKSKAFPAGEKLVITIDDKEQTWGEDGGGAMFKVKIFDDI